MLPTGGRRQSIFDCPSPGEHHDKFVLALATWSPSSARHSSIIHDPLDDHRMPHRHRMNHGAASRKTQATKSSSSRSAQQDGEAENPRNIVRTCLKTPIEHLCFDARDHEIMRRLDKNGVVRLLATEVKRAGGQSSWARRERIDRTILNKVLRGRKPPTEEIIRALKLCNMYEPDDCGAAD